MQFPDEMWSRDFPVHNGHLSVPDAPGHGLDLGPTARQRYGIE
jgi:L-alanine-DL-glutamate epimerase-like enolase superfamily enzyme